MLTRFARTVAAVVAAFAALVGVTTGSAQAAPEHGRAFLVMTDAPRDGEITLLDETCGGLLDPCGIAYNRTGSTLELSRDATSHFYCGAKGPYRDLPSGQNSNAYGDPRWPDVDCVRSRTNWIITNGRVYPPGEWIRIWTAKWFYGA